ncbi:hypothetical protein IGI66_001018 [Enterococcus sp. AZ048]|jgi:putative acetyltransferase|uniref:GNAT family N-acetyltransferase n=1 Tax=Enterococcus TaxID=1350 RepID=UPI00345E2864
MNTIKSVNKQALPALMTIWESSVHATHSFLTVEEIDALKPEVRNALLEIEHLYGYYAPNLIGFIGIENKKVDMLFVDASYRGQGVGKKLLQYALDTFHVGSVDVNEENRQGLGFYTHMGFQVDSRSALDGQGNPYPILHLKNDLEEDGHEN